MRTRILDLDGSLIPQEQLIRRSGARVLSFRDWGPSLRIACRFGSFRRFEERLIALTGSERDAEPVLHFLGSGDFHHVTLALLRRLPDPCNLLVFDNHPDWMRGLPLLHCGTWLYHAAQLDTVHRIFHVGGEVDFDNAYRLLAPWPWLRSGKIVVMPARRRFRGGNWSRIEHGPLPRPLSVDSLAPFAAELAALPLYVSMDKDVLTASEASVNWDSGHLTWQEVADVLEAFSTAAGAEWAGMDVVGDWSPVRLSGPIRRILHWIEHPRQRIDANEASRRNEAINLQLFERVSALDFAHLAA